MSACPGGDCGASHSSDVAACHPLKVEIFEPDRTVVEGWPWRDRVPIIVATARLPEFEGPRLSAAPATYVVLMWVGKLLIAREASIADSIADSKHPPLKRVRVQSPTTYRFAKSAVSADEKRLATFVPLGVCT